MSWVSESEQDAFEFQERTHISDTRFYVQQPEGNFKRVYTRGNYRRDPDFEAWAKWAPPCIFEEELQDNLSKVDDSTVQQTCYWVGKDSEDGSFIWKLKVTCTAKSALEVWNILNA
jgi:hypothetical protein